MGKIDISGLSDSFRQARNQCLVSVKLEAPKEKVSANKRRNVSSDKYSEFLKKYDDLANTVDSFSTYDLMYFFREKAREAGIKYVIANMKRDMGIFKRLQSNYEPREICLMIEFIFFSEQNYINKDITQPTILASGWCNKIYRDSLLWANDEYVPEKIKHKPLREYDGNREVTDAKIGDWEDE